MKNIINIPIYKRWLKENLFSTISSSFLTIISFISISIFLRSIFGFLISPEREWTAVTYNLQLYMVQAYPESDFLRVWLSVGLIVINICSESLKKREILTGGNICRKC